MTLIATIKSAFVIKLSRALRAVMIPIFEEFLRPRRNHFVLSLPKAGGSTLSRVITDTFPQDRLYHTHALSTSGLEQFHNSTCPGGLFAKSPTANGAIRNHVKNAYEGKRYLEENIFLKEGATDYFICGVREPIALFISLHFQFIECFDELGIELSTNTIRERLLEPDKKKLNLIGFDVTLDEWIELELERGLKIPVFNQAFDKTNGWQIYDESHKRLLIIRQENLHALPDALASLYDIPARFFLAPCEAENSTAKRNCFEQYQEVLENIRFPSDFLRQLYSSKYISTFYSRDEVRAFHERWSE